MSKRTGFLLFLSILALGVFFRFYLITEIPLGLYPDEAMNGNNALEALVTGEFKVFYPENNGREGLFINIQALSVWFFGNEPWTLRLVSTVFGTLTILGLYLVARELFRGRSGTAASLATLGRRAGTTSEQSEDEQGGHVSPKSALGILDGREDAGATWIALLSSFFLSTSYWHLNFSRIGFRAIAVPFFATFALYFLLRGLRTGKISSLVLAGVAMGLGLQTYIAFRFMPFVLAIPIVWYLWQWFKSDSNTRIHSNDTNKKCTPCAILLFLFITFVVALPIGYYFLQNPGDFLGRGGQVSIFSAESPLIEFVKSNVATLGMFFVRGDCNWRHNFNCQPELHPLVAAFFLIGLAFTIRELFSKTIHYRLPTTGLLAWLIFMSFPTTLTREGLPHALRSIGMLPPVMILAGIGAWQSINWILNWLEKNKFKWPEYAHQLLRIQREIVIFFIFVLLLMPLATYKNYFITWANSPNAYWAFATDTLHAGQYLKGLPPDTKKYVMVNLSGVEVRAIPMPAQTVMFVTDTFRAEERNKKNLFYLTRENWQDQLKIPENKKTVVVFLNGSKIELINAIRKEFPQLKPWVPSDFTILKNY